MGYYGLTLKEAREQGYDAEEGIATYDMCLRGRVFSPDGMLKLTLTLTLTLALTLTLSLSLTRCGRRCT